MREVVLIEAIVRHMRGVQVEQRTEQSTLLVILLKELFGESTLLGCQVEQFLVVVFGTKVKC